jgi:hypothetical protein
MKQNPEMKITEVSKHIAERWKVPSFMWQHGAAPRCDPFRQHTNLSLRAALLAARVKALSQGE